MKDIWPDPEEIDQFVQAHVHPVFYKDQYEHIFKGDKLWQELEVSRAKTFDFEPDSTYIRNPPFFENFSLNQEKLQDVKDARPLLILGDSVTTDHISPAGAIPADYPAGSYLKNAGVLPFEFNSYGSRRGNHEVMMRGTFANIRIKNLLADKAGGFTLKFPEKEILYVFDAAEKYREQGTELIVFGGKEYGTGSSRDWAAKGTCLLGVRAVIAQSFERIHRSNLVGMGVVPLVFQDSESFDSLGLKGDETYSIKDLDTIRPNSRLSVVAEAGSRTVTFKVIAKLNTDIEIEYIRHKGILHYVLGKMISA